MKKLFDYFTRICTSATNSPWHNAWLEKSLMFTGNRTNQWTASVACNRHEQKMRMNFWRRKNGIIFRLLFRFVDHTFACVLAWFAACLFCVLNSKLKIQIITNNWIESQKEISIDLLPAQTKLECKLKCWPKKDDSNDWNWINTEKK